MEGDKNYYRCNRVKARGKQCSASLYLHFENTSYRVLLYKSTSIHDCDISVSKAGPVLTNEVKNKIEELADQQLKPIVIQDRLRGIKLPIPKKYIIANHLAKYKREKFGPPSISQSELRTLLDAYKNISNEPDVPLVLQDDANEDKTLFVFL